MKIYFIATAVSASLLAMTACKSEPKAGKSAGAIHSKIKQNTQTTATAAVGESNIAFFSERHMDAPKRLRQRQQRLQEALQ